MIPAQWNAPLNTYQMGPLEILDYGIAWTSWLQPGETIAGTPTVTQSDGDGQLTINPNGNATLVSAGVVTWWLATPTVGQTYNVHATITTNQGRTSTRRICIQGVNR
jgi:hypothetical protein